MEVAVLLASNSSPFGGIPRNWKHLVTAQLTSSSSQVPPSGGSLEIGNVVITIRDTIRGSPFGGIPRNWKLPFGINPRQGVVLVPPSGGSLEIGNDYAPQAVEDLLIPGNVPPSGGSLEIGNS